MIVIHFGSGDEEDYEGLCEFLQPFEGHNLHIFPGVSYGVIEFKDVQQAQSLIGITTEVPNNPFAYTIEINFRQKVRTIFFFYTDVPLNQFNRQRQTDIPNGSAIVDVPGLFVIPDFVTPEEEAIMLKEIDKHKWNPLAQRRVQHYGYEFVYGSNNVDKNKYIGTLPDFAPGVNTRINQIAQKYNHADFDQLTLNDYSPGQGIPPHVDTHSPFEECLASLSLGSGVVMTFKDDKNFARHIFLPQRSLAVFVEEARYAFYHSIATRKLDRVDGRLFFRRRRVSLTYRKVRHVPCKCKWPQFCDSQNVNPLPVFEQHKKGEVSEDGDADAEEVDVKEEPLEEGKGNENTKPSDLEKNYVYKTYEKIAPHFSSTRYKAWPKIEKFLNELPFGSIVADIGNILS